MRVNDHSLSESELSVQEDTSQIGGNRDAEYRDLLDTSQFLEKRHDKFAGKKLKIKQCKCDAEYHLALEAIKEQKDCGMI